LDVLRLIVEEYTNQEIADKLFISVRTVDAHRRNLLEKTGARNTAGLVKFAIERNLFNNNNT
jgi:DNA-binding CsgD family transcriptional regulator